MTQQTIRDKGAALINALLVVAALASVATVLLSRSTAVHLRQAQTQEHAQAKAYLDGFETLLMSILTQDKRAGVADTLKEPWAQENYTVQIGQAQMSATLRDLQGRFNINWLAGGDVTNEQAAFERLLQAIGQPATLSQSITAWVSENGPENVTPYRSGALGISPQGGPMAVVEDLRLVTPMTPAQFDQLAVVLSALPTEPIININTAPADVVRAFLPGMAPGTLEELLILRRTDPFVDADELDAWFSKNLSEEDRQTLGVDRFGISSNWFEAHISVSFGKTHLHRKLILHRSGESGKTRVELRLIDP